MKPPKTPFEISDPVNARILAVSEDKLEGFHRDPVWEIARQTGLAAGLVTRRLRAMLEEGTIRRVRQTLLATNLAQGALVAWQVPAEKLDAAFDYMFQKDPFSGHVVLRSTDTATAGSNYKLWTTLESAAGVFACRNIANFWRGKTGRGTFSHHARQAAFALGVGHIRRRGLEPGARADDPGGGDGRGHRAIERTGMARLDGAQAGICRRRRSGRICGARGRRRPGFRWRRFIKSRRT